MHRLRFLVILLTCASVVLPRPLQIIHVTSSSGEGPNVYSWNSCAGRDTRPDIPITTCPSRQVRDTIHQLSRAEKEANLMLDKMDRVAADPTKPEHKAILASSFGSIGALRRGVARIRDKLHKIKTANIRIRVHPLVPPAPDDVTPGNDIPAWTRFIPPNAGAARSVRGDAPTNNQAHVADSIMLGQKFFDLGVKGRAGVLIHQAAHYAAHASDDLLVTEWELSHIPARYPKHSNIHPLFTDPPESDRRGFRPSGAVKPENLDHPAATPSANLLHPVWLGTQGHAYNMEECADAYRVMAHLCDAAIPDTDAATSDTDAHVLKRALPEGDSTASCPPKKINIVALTKGH